MKKAKNIKAVDKKPIIGAHGEEVLMTWEDMPVMDIFIEDMIKKLPNWPDEHPESFFLEDFFFARKIPERTWDRLVDKHPRLKEAQEIAKRKIGNKLMAQSMARQLNWQPVSFCLHTFGDKFKKMDKYHKELQDSVPENATQWAAIIAPVKQTEKLDEFIKKQKEKDNEKTSLG